jgi:hypothetical protein
MSVTAVGTAMQLDKFWRWLQEHHNCIVRAGTRDAVLYDQDDLHWHLYEDGEHNIVIQLMRGKELMGEFSISRPDVMFVEATPAAEGEGQFEFNLVGGPEGEPLAMYHFLMAHGVEETDEHGPQAFKH